MKKHFCAPSCTASHLEIPPIPRNCPPEKGHQQGLFNKREQTLLCWEIRVKKLHLPELKEKSSLFSFCLWSCEGRLFLPRKHPSC